MPIIFGVKRRPIHSFHANSYVREIKTFANWNISPKCMFCGNNRTIIISINMIYKSNRDKMQRVCYSNRSKCLTHQKTARRVRLIESFHTVISILPPHIHTHKISQCMRTHWFLVENQCRSRLHNNIKRNVNSLPFNETEKYDWTCVCLWLVWNEGLAHSVSDWWEKGCFGINHTWHSIFNRFEILHIFMDSVILQFIHAYGAKNRKSRWNPLKNRFV